MSVSKMKRLTVLVHRDEVDSLMRRLIRLRCVEVTEADGSLAGTDFLRPLTCQRQRSEGESSVSEIRAALAVLNPYSSQRRSLFRPKRKVDFTKFSSDRAWEIVKRSLAVKEREGEIDTEIASLTMQILSENPYKSYDLPLGMTGTERAEIRLGALPPGADFDAVRKDLGEADGVAKHLGADGSGRYVAVICHEADSDAVASVLTAHGFVRADFRGIEGTAAEHIREMEERISVLREERESLTGEYGALARGLEAVEALYDRAATELTAIENKEKLLSTNTTAILSGWVPEDAEQRVRSALSSFTCAYELTLPHADENPPVLLKNHSFAANFEWVLGMYSYPAYGRFDPTGIMSVFYLLIFGLMFADAGYGFLLILGCFGAIRIGKPSEGAERFLRMFGYCGVSCVIFGVLFGAYFGDLPLAIMRNMLMIPEDKLPNLALLGSSSANVALLFDPLQNPMAFLVISLGVGAVHLIAGMAVRFVLLCREGRAIDALLDIGAYWLLFLGLGLLALLPSVGIWVTVLGAALIVLGHGRREARVGMKLLKGLTGLYDLVGYASDLLSYSRILALGLSASVIAQVVNILGTMGGPTVMGVIGLVLAFSLGHLLNVAINVLGTFVHTSRLQYIEFFNKFYEEGGVAFDPMLPSETYTEEE